MNLEFEYYYNNVPGKGQCRNNLIYTSLISKDRKTFCQWYYNETDYHRGQNQIVDPALMQEKFDREVYFLQLMGSNFPDLVPKFDIDLNEKKIYLEIDGPDIWELVGCQGQDYGSVIDNWREQMFDIFKAHHSLGLYKYSLHPSSYFLIRGRLKSINYFFTYNSQDRDISLRSVMSHISLDRQQDLFPKMAGAGIDVDKPTPHKQIQLLAFESFKTNFPEDLMEEAKKIYV